MTFAQLAAERYSLRKFDSRPVEAEKLQALLAAARLAPTACNNQPQRILVLNEEAALQKLDGATQYRFGAPLALLVCYDKDAVWQRASDGHSSGDVDAAIVGSHIMLQATELGLGSCWVMAFDPVAMRKAYSIPENVEPVALFPIGYPAPGAGPSRLHTDRQPVESGVMYNTFQIE